MIQHATLADLWFIIMAVVMWLYLITDGFDLGAGILSLFERNEDVRGLMAYSIEPVWHANQTWLVILGGVIFGAFPHVYAAIFPGLYIPAVLLLAFFIARGVAIEYRPEAENKRLFSLLFGVGSLGAAITQGLLLGAVLQGMPIKDGVFTGGPFDWFTPFSWIMAAALCVVYSMLGAIYLVMKTRDELRAHFLRWAKVCGLASAVMVAVVILWANAGAGLERYAKSWFVNGFSFSTWFMPVALSFIMYFQAIRRKIYSMAYCWTCGMILFTMAAFGGALHPYIVPPDLTVAQAAAAEESLTIMLYVIGPVLPIILIYSIYQYVVFRGPAEPESH